MNHKQDCWLKSGCNQIDCDKDFCLKYYKLNFLYDSALVPLNLRYPLRLRYDSDGTDRDVFVELDNIRNNILEFVKNGKNLFIYSNIAGNGKTSWSLKLLSSYLKSIWAKSNLECHALFINVPKFLLALKDNINERSEYVSHIKENVYKADLVVWDDIATKNITSFEAENLLSIIDTRISLGKSNIYTSNLNGQEIHECLGDRLYSRVVNGSINVNFKGADKRILMR